RRNGRVASLPVEVGNLVARRHERSVEAFPLQVAAALHRAVQVRGLFLEAALPDDGSGLAVETKRIPKRSDCVDIFFGDGRSGAHAELAPADVPDRRHVVAVAPFFLPGAGMETLHGFFLLIVLELGVAEVVAGDRRMVATGRDGNSP